MEPYRKRQRIDSPRRGNFPRSFGNQYAHYYGDDQDELEGYGSAEDAEQYEDEENLGNDLRDTDSDFEEKRAQVDLKLKSAYESIFERYERDFDGIGDEIDMETGEIVVDNGHLSQMLDEKDTGQTRHRRYDSTEESTELEEDSGDSSGLEENIDDDDQDDEEGEEDEVTEDGLSEDDMMEDDLILRGFTQATRGRLTEPSLHHSHAPSRPVEDPGGSHIARAYVPGAELPSRSAIIAQFGPHLGPRILDVVSHQNTRTWDENDRSVESAWRIPEHLEHRYAHNNRNVEPAWRVPDIPISIPKSRPLAKAHTNKFNTDRSVSPEAGYSIWAPVPNNKPFKGPNKYIKDSSNRRIRNAFTVEDDETLLDCVKKARLRGRKLNQSFWLGLGAQVSPASTALLHALRKIVP
jgi:hypothetical protein